MELFLFGKPFRWLVLCSACMALTFLLGASALAELPVQVRADILAKQIIDAVKAKDSRRVLDKVAEYRALEKEGHTTPPQIIFTEATNAVTAGDFPRALRALTDYLAVADRNDAYYVEAIDMYESVKAKAMEVERDPRYIAEQEAKRRAEADAPYSKAMVELPGLGVSMGKYEVTQGQWRAVMGDNPSYFSSCGDDCPVESVSWDDVQQFVKKLNAKTGQKYRLPTEREWEAACLAGGRTEYCGSDDVDSVAWYDGNSAGRTHSVGLKAANGWGLYDMSGNVWEWTSDCYDGDCGRRVLRGGSWLGLPVNVRAAYRLRLTPDYRLLTIGFRLARTD